jgi:hypothetical protein
VSARELTPPRSGERLPPHADSSPLGRVFDRRTIEAMQGFRRSVTLATVLGLALAAPSAADAANTCRAKADKGKVLVESGSAVVYATGKQFNHYVWSCAFKTGKPYKLPGQDGGDVNRLFTPVLNGRSLAYFIFTQEEASPVAYSYVYSVDVVKRQKLIEAFSGDPKKADDSTTDVKALVVGSKGAIAWITESINLDVKLSVRSKAPGAKATLLDNGNDVDAHSLALAGNNKTLYWTRGGIAKTSALP